MLIKRKKQIQSFYNKDLPLGFFPIQSNQRMNSDTLNLMSTTNELDKLFC